MELKPNRKQTAANALPSAWAAVQLGSYVKITSGKSPSLFRFSRSGIPYFKVEQLSNSEKYLGASDTPYLFESGPTITAKSVVFAKRGAAIALNKVRILSENSFMDTNLMALTPQDSLDSDYLYYSLSFIGLWRFADTTSVPQINNKHVKPLAFQLPTVKEQRAIAQALSDVDALLYSLNALIAKKRDLKQAAMQQLLTGQTRLPGFSGEWEEKRLGEIADIFKGTSLSKSSITTIGAHECILYGELFTTYGRVISNVVSRTNLRKGFSSKAGDVILPASTTTTGADLATASALLVDDVALGGDILVVRKRGGEIDPVFLASYLTHAAKNQIAELTQGITIHHLYGKNLKTLRLQLPSLTEQIAIATALTEMETELEALENRRNKTADLKQGIMQELLTGRTRLV
jgi:type I restriction enzyme S subunit